MRRYGNSLSLCILQAMTMACIRRLVSLAQTTKGADSLNLGD